MRKRLENICESLMELLQRGKQIDEEQAHVFFESADDYLNGGEDESKSAKLDKLTTYLQKKWQYREIESMNSNQAFLCGSIWGVTKLLGMKQERKEKAFRLDELRKQYSGHYDFLYAIAVNPGIKHNGLAEKCNKNISSLVKFVTKAKMDRLILCCRIGRETYYYLRPLGERIYYEIKKKNIMHYNQ